MAEPFKYALDATLKNKLLEIEFIKSCKEELNKYKKSVSKCSLEK
jgi:hypothetical protein